MSTENKVDLMQRRWKVIANYPDNVQAVGTIIQPEEKDIIELIKGTFERDNGLYCYDVTAPSIWDEEEKDFDSIYHLFGNDLQRFSDCEIVNN